MHYFNVVHPESPKAVQMEPEKLWRKGFERQMCVYVWSKFVAQLLCHPVDRQLLDYDHLLWHRHRRFAGALIPHWTHSDVYNKNIVVRFLSAL